MNSFILYSYFRSSASYRVRIALNLKNIPYEYRAIHLLENGGQQNKPDYHQLNPSGEVPTLIHNGNRIGQSLAIIEYLDEVTGNHRLFPQDAYQKALVRQACEIVNSGIQPLGNLKVLQYLEQTQGFDQEKKTAWTIHWIERGLRSLENFLKPHAETYCFGSQVTAADTFLVPQVYNAYRYKMNMGEFPTLERVYRNCLKLEAFQKAQPEAQPDTPAELRQP